jgi:hypothetical protein
MFTSAEKLTVELPFVILNSVAIQLEVGLLDKSDFTLTWDNPTVHFSSFLDVTNQGDRFSVGKLLPNSFQLITQSLVDRVKEKAIFIENNTKNHS